MSATSISSTLRPPTRSRAVTVLVVAAVLNVGVALLLAAAIDASDDFRALQAGPVAFATLLGVGSGLAVHAVARRRGAQARTYVLVVLGAALVSLVGPAQLALDHDVLPGTTTAAALALVPLHLLPAVVLLAGLGHLKAVRS